MFSSARQRAQHVADDHMDPKDDEIVCQVIEPNIPHLPLGEMRAPYTELEAMKLFPNSKMINNSNGLKLCTNCAGCSICANAFDTAVFDSTGCFKVPFASEAG